MERIAAHMTLSSGLYRFGLAFVFGAFAALALAPVNLFIAAFVSFSVLLWLLEGAVGNPSSGIIGRNMPAFLVGWAFGLGYFVAGLWWTANALLVEADEYAWALPLAIFGLPAYLAIFYGLATMLARLLWTDGGLRLFSLAAAFGLMEWLRGFVLTGFPWNAIGQALMPFPLMMQSVFLTGSLLMNVIAVFIFASPGLLVGGRRSSWAFIVAMLLLGAHLGYGAYRLNFREPESTQLATAPVVRIVQPMIDQAAKINDSERGRIFEEHLALTREPPPAGGKVPDIILWPETSIPFILTRNPDALSKIADTLSDGQILIAGAVRVESDNAIDNPRFYNSIYMIDSQGQIIGAADKVHLVPFGEYLPLETLWSKIGLTAIAADMPGGYSAATNRQLLTTPAGLKLWPLICYEVVFPELSSDVNERADAIVNVTNDGWFGNSSGPYQHFQQARIRAVEFGVGLIRNSNSGISAIINPYGELLKGLDYQVKGFVDGPIPHKILPILHERTRFLNFGLIELLIFATLLFSRVSFIFNRN